MIGPRQDYWSSDDVFMAIALVVAQRSKDPNTQVGACIVSEHNKILGTGYNGFPSGISNNDLPWDRVGRPDQTKYLYVEHAEANAINYSDKTRMSGARIYTTLFPCNRCAIGIIQNKIGEVIYLSDKYHDEPEFIASRKLFTLSGTKIRKFSPQILSATIDLKNGTIK